MLLGKRPLRRRTVTSADGVLKAIKAFGAEVVSVDIFDTLVFRQLREPKDVFCLQYQQSVETLGSLPLQEWLDARKATERLLAKAVWPAEIELSAIYGRLAEQFNLSAEASDRLLHTELAIEAEVIRPYRDLADVLRRMQAAGCTIAFTTDTYLPESFLRKLLDGFLDFEYVLLSSSKTGKTKRSGRAFALLQSMFPARKIVHFGDNGQADFDMAHGSGVQAFVTCWDRQVALAQPTLSRYARALGVTRLRTPWDDFTAPHVSPLVEIAWRWSFVLADFLASLRAYVDEVQATDIWFLSRDCETMFKSLTDVPGLFSGKNCRYVYGSRACVYPVIARSQPGLYERWRGKPTTAETERDGDIARAYYNSLVSSDTSRILIVDIGWKGRLQILFKTILPEDIDVFGYYFSLEPGAEPATIARSKTFVGWDLSVFNQAMVEALSGYREASAIGMACKSGEFDPVFREGAGDRSPIGYCEALAAFLTTLLLGRPPGPASATPADAEARRAMVRQMSLYPDRTLISGFAQWKIATLIDGSDTGNIANGGRASVLHKLVGRSDSGNVWPSAAVWTLTTNRMLGRVLQHVIRLRFAAQRYLLDTRRVLRFRE